MQILPAECWDLHHTFGSVRQLPNTHIVKHRMALRDTRRTITDKTNTTIHIGVIRVG